MHMPCAPAPAADRLDDLPRACGWFDSSHDLRAGLSVTEHGAPDDVARLVPLGWWLDWQLRSDAPGVC